MGLGDELYYYRLLVLPLNDCCAYERDLCVGGKFLGRGYEPRAICDGTEIELNCIESTFLLAMGDPWYAKPYADNLGSDEWPCG